MTGVKNKNVKRLLEKYKEISLLNKIQAVLDWDLNVNLPANASQGRANQTAYLTGLVADKWLDEEFKALLTEITETDKDLEDTERAIVRNLKHAAKFYHRVPKEIIVEKAETTSKAFMIWQEAKSKNDFKSFAPHLEKIVHLNQIIADHLISSGQGNRYDALLDQFEPGLTTKQCQEIFFQIKTSVVPLLKKIKASKLYQQQQAAPLLSGEFSTNDQRQLSLFVLRKMGYDFNSGRMDISSHPFTSTLDRYDVRITNRYKPDNFVESIMVAMHEGGHALYELGVDESYSDTPIEGGVSLGIHESQSRFWENQIGRSEEFLEFLMPILYAFYPDQLNNIDESRIISMFNQVNPGLIRVEADEVTYNLHIALRFELEEALINNKIEVQALPQLWKHKMKKYLGVLPPNDTVGILQDVHWSYGVFGYFPTYTLGNLYAAQFTDTLKKEIKLEELSKNGQLGTILSYLRTSIHQYGSLYWPDELIKKVTDKPLNSKFFVRYITEKYSKIYQLN